MPTSAKTTYRRGTQSNVRASLVINDQQNIRMLIKDIQEEDHDIILECGFHNKAYFYREFAKLHNCSPKDFRAQHGQEESF